MSKVKVRFKRSPMHEATPAGVAKVGATLQAVFDDLPKGFARAIKENTRVIVSNPNRETCVVEPKAFKWRKLDDGDIVTIVAVPGEPFSWTVIAIAVAISAAVSIVLSLIFRPKIPKSSGGPEGGTLYNLGGDNNAEAYRPIPCVYGTIRAPLKYVAQPAGIVSATSRVEADDAAT